MYLLYMCLAALNRPYSYIHVLQDNNNNNQFLCYILSSILSVFNAAEYSIVHSTVVT